MIDNVVRSVVPALRIADYSKTQLLSARHSFLNARNICDIDVAVAREAGVIRVIVHPVAPRKRKARHKDHQDSCINVLSQHRLKFCAKLQNSTWGNLPIFAKIFRPLHDVGQRVTLSVKTTTDSEVPNALTLHLKPLTYGT